MHISRACRNSIAQTNKFCKYVTNKIFPEMANFLRKQKNIPACRHRRAEACSRCKTYVYRLMLAGVYCTPLTDLLSEKPAAHFVPKRMTVRAQMPRDH